MDPNRVSADFTTVDQERALTLVGSLRQKMPFLVDLSVEERVKMPKLGDKSHTFVRKALEIGTQHPAMLPASFLEEMRKDAQLFEALAPIKLAVDLLKKQIDDTLTQVGAEAYAAARTVYAVTKAPFVRAAMRTAADDLGKRFGRKPRNTTASVEPPASTPEALPASFKCVKRWATEP